MFKMAWVKNSLQPCLQTAINEEQHANTDQEGIIEYVQIIEYSEGIEVTKYIDKKNKTGEGKVACLPYAEICGVSTFLLADTQLK